MIPKIKIVTVLIIVVAVASIFYYAWPKAPGPGPVEYPESVLSWAENIRSKYGGTELTVVMITHPSTDAFKKMIPEFENLTGIKVNISEYDEVTYTDKLMVMLGEGTIPYDGFACAMELLPTLAMYPEFGYPEMIVPIDDFIADKSLTPEWFDFEDILPAYRDIMSYGGKTYGIMMAGETVMVMYRKDLFEKYDKEPPRTYDELLDLAKFFKEEVPEVEAGVSIRAETGFQNMWSWGNFLYGYGGGMIDPTTMTAEFNKKETVDSLKYFINLCEYGPVGILGYSFPEAWANFREGKSAMLVEASAACPGNEDPEQSVVAGKIGYAKFPTGPAGECAGVYGTGILIPAASEHKEAMWSLIVWLTSKYNSPKYLEYGGVANRVSDLEKKTYPYYETILKTVMEAGNTPLAKKMRAYYAIGPDFYPLWLSCATFMGQAQVGNITPEEACDEMQAAAETIIAKFVG